VSANNIIVETEIPTRLDRYLKRINPNLTQGLIEQLLRNKKITLNDQKVQARHRVINGDKILIPLLLHTDTDNNVRIFSHSSIKLAEKILNQYIIYDHQEFIAINKPAGLATQGGSKINISIDESLSYLNHKNSNFKLVHRLDKDTSGILLIAKNHSGAYKLTQGFKDKVIQKTYIAVVLGAPLKKAGEISGLISKANTQVSKLAITQYRVLKTTGELSLIEFTAITGRMHQLRLHAQALGCPIIGDLKYGNKLSSSKSDHMLLHAKKIVISSTIFGEDIIIQAEIPSYFKRFFEYTANTSRIDYEV
jgi:23S rRNA pseudouridine955/2504/2580 synthase